MMNISITVTRPESTSTRGTSAKLEIAVDEYRDDEGIDGGDGRGLGRREHAAVDAADHDDDQQQAPHRLAEQCETLAPGDLRLARQIHDARGNVDRHHQQAPSMMPGMTPAMNSRPTEVSVAAA